MTTVPRSRDLVLAWKQAATNMEDLHVALRTLTKLQTVNHVLRLHTIHARRRPADNVADLAHCQHFKDIARGFTMFAIQMSLPGKLAHVMQRKPTKRLAATPSATLCPARPLTNLHITCKINSLIQSKYTYVKRTANAR